MAESEWKKSNLMRNAIEKRRLELLLNVFDNAKRSVALSITKSQTHYRNKLKGIKDRQREILFAKTGTDKSQSSMEEFLIHQFTQRSALRSRPNRPMTAHVPNEYQVKETNSNLQEIEKLNQDAISKNKSSNQNHRTKLDLRPATAWAKLGDKSQRKENGLKDERSRPISAFTPSSPESSYSKAVSNLTKLGLYERPSHDPNNHKTDINSQKSDINSQKSDINSQKSDINSQKSEKSFVISRPQSCAPETSVLKSRSEKTVLFSQSQTPTNLNVSQEELTSLNLSSGRNSKYSSKSSRRQRAKSCEPPKQALYIDENEVKERRAFYEMMVRNRLEQEREHFTQLLDQVDVFCKQDNPSLAKQIDPFNPLSALQ